MSNPVLGAESLAYGALAADVGLVTGYPGSPVTGVFDSIVAAAEPGRNLDASWAPNEKVAMEMAIGASIGGQRALVILKSVGLNIALDPLATATYSGCPRGLVILLGDDPGAWGSQNEQDSRWSDGWPVRPKYPSSSQRALTRRPRSWPRPLPGPNRPVAPSSSGSRDA